MAAVEKVYGDALFSLLRDEGNDTLTKGFEQLKAVSVVLSENKELVKVLSVPTVELSEKLSLLKEIFSGRVQDYILNFLYVLCENKRVGYYDKILQYITTLYNDYMNIADVTVVSAMPLSEETAERIRAKMTAVMGKTVNLMLKTDPALIGGVVISYGNSTIDGSVRARLDDLKNEIAKG